MKYKVSDLDGEALGAAVALAEGLALGDVDGWLRPRIYMAWAHAGPIIERERITLSPQSDGGWLALPRRGGIERGADPRIAAMRAYVASKFGDEVELP